MINFLIIFIDEGFEKTWTIELTNLYDYATAGNFCDEIEHKKKEELIEDIKQLMENNINIIKLNVYKEKEENK